MNYITTVDTAQWSLQDFTKYSLSAANTTGFFSKALVKATGLMKNLAAGLANAAIWFIAEKAIEGIVYLIQNNIQTQEKLDEAAQKAADDLDSVRQKLSDTKENLADINSQIDTLLSKGSLTFVEEQELQKLREQKALLQDTIALNEKQVKQQKETYLSAKKKAYDSSSDFDNTPYKLGDSDSILMLMVQLL